MTTNNQLMAAMPLSDVEKMAVAIAKSGLFGVKTPDQALALMLVAQAEGMHPAIAARDYHIIEGRPALKADAMLARFHSCGGTVVWNELTDKKVSATFTHPQGGKATITWDWSMAERAQLTQRQQRDGKPNMWQKFPRQMLRARVISEGIRTVFPGVVVGAYTPEEIQDMDEPRNITPAVEPEKPKKATSKAKTEQSPQDAEIVQPDPVSAPEKVEPAKADPKNPVAIRNGLLRTVMELSAKYGETPQDMRKFIGEDILSLKRPIKDSTEIPNDRLEEIIKCYNIRIAEKSSEVQQ